MGVRRSYLRTEGDPIFKPLPVFLPATEQGGGGLNLKENAMIQHDSDCAVHNAAPRFRRGRVTAALRLNMNADGLHTFVSGVVERSLTGELLLACG